MKVRDETTAAPEQSANALSRHHHELDQRFAALVARAQGGDPVQLRVEWASFERALLRHLELEEAEVLPGFARHDPTGARAILDDHARVRRTLLELGLDLDLHLLRAQVVEAFVRQLRDHAASEESAFYAWANRNLTGGDWRAIEAGLRQTADRRA